MTTGAGVFVPARSELLAGSHRGPADLGPLSPYLADSAVTDLLVNGASGLWLDRGAGLTRDRSFPLRSERDVRELAVSLVARGGRHIDEASPCVDVRLGTLRVHVALPPVSVSGTLISVRVPATRAWRLSDLRSKGMFSAAEQDLLVEAVSRRENLLITGAAGSGKTSLLAALLAEAPVSQRIITVEDVAELRIDHPHVVGMEARQANIDGAGMIGLDRLVREALRMRPDRLVVGECRGAEVRDLLGALSTGQDGGAGTLHANSLSAVPARLEALASLAGMSVTAIARQAVSAFDLVLHLDRSDGHRTLDSIGRLVLSSRGRLRVEPVRGPDSLPTAPAK